ncbi:hypothetical protein LTR95_002120 [Oleoguttula sp. CCFEE 5521]
MIKWEDETLQRLGIRNTRTDDARETEILQSSIMASAVVNGTPIANGKSHSTPATSVPEPGVISTPYLIVGAGPAGASLACFLASHGQTGIILSAASGTAREPRAHITNPAALECLREIGLEDACHHEATPGSHMQHTRWCHSMAGEEYARIHSWGNQPERAGEYAAASPCKHVDLPILVNKARGGGWKVRFDSTFVEFEREGEDGEITSTVKDELSGVTYKIKSKYLFGCDGARSPIMKQLDIPLKKEPGQGLAINIQIKADLEKYMTHRTGNLHWVFTPEIEHPSWGWTCIFRLVKAWDEWLAIVLPSPTFDMEAYKKNPPSQEEYLKRVREFVGDDKLPVEIIDVSKWYVNEIVAEQYSSGNIFCLGDAVHRHPPFNGLGSNTCVQDAYNLAWKVAYVEKDLADKKLLHSYSAERQPIGEGVIRRANQGLRDHTAVWEALGVLPQEVEERKRQFGELSQATAAGRERRKKLQEAVAYTAHEFGGIGVEMNQRYESSAVVMADEKAARRAAPEDPVLQYQLSTYPGSRLPHAWLNSRVPVEPISTIDIAGHGAFCLLTGIGGGAWKEAAKKAGEKLGVDVKAYSIGWNQDWEDVYGDWANRREVDEDGVILCRPDRTVAWRSMGPRQDAAEVVERVIGKVLGRE